MQDSIPAALPMAGVKVIDAATIYAGPVLATMFGDFGADVIKVEHPAGDGLRGWGWRKGGESLWWTVVGRNKRSVSVNLSKPAGADVLRKLVADADVLVENFRPGTMEKWGLDPEDLLEINPRLVVVRVSGFGQTGPYRERPGFGTLAESFSGFAATNGASDGPPVLPQWPLADGVAALAGAFATMVALRHAEATGQGQVVDLSIYEPLFWILGAQTSAYDQLGEVARRLGSSTDFNVPRETFQTRDDKWVALSGATTATARRIMLAIGRDDLADAPWFDDIDGRVEHRAILHDAIQEWVVKRDFDDVLRRFTVEGATVGPVYAIDDIVADPHFNERGSIIEVDHPRFGRVKMQGLIARLTETPGRVRTPAPERGADSRSILVDELGIDEDVYDRLVVDGIVRDLDEES